MVGRLAMRSETDLWQAVPLMPWAAPAKPCTAAKASLDAISPALVALLRVAREITAHGTPDQLRQYHHHIHQLVQAVRAQRLHGSGFVMDMLAAALEQRLRGPRGLDLCEAPLLAIWPSLWITEVLGCGESGTPLDGASVVLDCLQGLQWFPALSAPLTLRLQRWLAQDRARFATAVGSAEVSVDAEPLPLLHLDFYAELGPAARNHTIVSGLPKPLLL